MAETTITGLPNATTPLAGDERVPMDQNGTTVDGSTQDIANLAGAAITAAVSAHEEAADPHPGYLTPAEADNAYAEIADARFEQTLVTVRNQTGSLIAKGVAVSFAGTVGASGRLLVKPTIANGSEPGYVFLGVTAQAIVNGEDGAVLTWGKIFQVNTNAFEEGDILWVNPAVPGGFVSIEPAAPNLKLPVAAVVNKGVANGILMVRSSIGQRLQDLHDVEANGSKTNRDTLVWNQSALRWEADALTAADVGADAAGTASSAVSSHVGEEDPHTQYALEANLATVATSGAYGDLSGRPTIPTPADAAPLAPGTAAVGSSTDYAREDHVHPLPDLVTSTTAGRSWRGWAQLGILSGNGRRIRRDSSRGPRQMAASGCMTNHVTSWGSTWPMIPRLKQWNRRCSGCRWRWSDVWQFSRSGVFGGGCGQRRCARP
jgi:hypothetical protein